LHEKKARKHTTMGNTADKAAYQSVNLSGKVVIVTGANTGIGYITALELAKLGAHVFVACRNKERAEDAIKKMREISQQGDSLKLDSLAIDLSSLSSIESGVADFLSKNVPLHILINNAGLAVMERAETKDGFETQAAVNHLGPFHLTTLLLPTIKKSGPSRIITLSSMMHTRGKIIWDDFHSKNCAYSGWDAYSMTKLANVLFTRELQRRLDEEGAKVTAFSVHPGFVKTEFTRNLTSVTAGIMAVATSVIAKNPRRRSTSVT